MKKSLAIILMLVLCFAISACASEKPSDESSPASTTEQSSNGESTPSTEKPDSVSYTYKVQAMQGAECRYYGPNDNVPNSPDPSKVQGKIVVWTQCPNCGSENISHLYIDPAELDFSSGDTIMYSDTDSCYDCYWDRDIKQFMWTLQITRTPA